MKRKGGGSIYYDAAILEELTPGATVNGVRFEECRTEEAIEMFLESITDQVVSNGFFEDENWKDE
ncbi:hypothetical protein [Alkalibacillus haloalkaliphilus]|uniref:hypothetical protein n=1 Tax=Alkalibacillus haloalkaliphilus TaxID=94136 RepID=UPI0029353FED|nr:hypothetical protein [Alkalibacillus haloalkaliphilus]MDV2581670.1 hypothetical protein [Alkalibacillus haloalkaliphilus]